MKEVVVYKEIPLKDTEAGTLKFAVIEEPYGDTSEPVVSVCAHLSDEQQWVVHIPLKQVKDVCKILKQSKCAYKTFKKDKKKEAKKTTKAKEAKPTSAAKAPKKAQEPKESKKAAAANP